MWCYQEHCCRVVTLKKLNQQKPAGTTCPSFLRVSTMHQCRSYFAVDLCDEEINAVHFTCQCHISLPTGWSCHSLLTPGLSSSTLTANSSIQLLQCWDSKKSETIRIVLCHRFGTNCSQSRCWSLYVWQYVCMCVSRQTRLPALPSFASANGTMMPVSDHCNYTFKFLHWCQMLPHPSLSLSCPGIPVSMV